LLGNTLPQHLILRLEKLDLSAQFVFGTTCQEEQELLKEPSHGHGFLDMNTLKQSDILFAPRCLSARRRQVNSAAVC